MGRPAPFGRFMECTWVHGYKCNIIGVTGYWPEDAASLCKRNRCNCGFPKLKSPLLVPWSAGCWPQMNV